MLKEFIDGKEERGVVKGGGSASLGGVGARVVGGTKSIEGGLIGCESVIATVSGTAGFVGRMGESGYNARRRMCGAQFGSRGWCSWVALEKFLEFCGCVQKFAALCGKGVALVVAGVWEARGSIGEVASGVDGSSSLSDSSGVEGR